MTRPWPRLIPPTAKPNAWLRCSAGAARTKAALAASWKHVNTPDAAKISRAGRRGGERAKSMRTVQAATASGPITLSRRAGLTARPNTSDPIDAPRTSKASSSPTVTEPPPREWPRAFYVSADGGLPGRSRAGRDRINLGYEVTRRKRCKCYRLVEHSICGQKWLRLVQANESDRPGAK